MHFFRIGPRWRLKRALFGLAALAVSASLAENAPPPRRLSALERMAREHLKAAHADVLRLARLRKTLPPIPGLRDFRTVIHAHASDSAHTGGTLDEILSDAKRAGVQVICLTDHYRPPRDFMAGWRGLRDGVLILPGSEARGFMLFPTRSMMDQMEDPLEQFIPTVRSEGGLIFLSHLEERLDHSTAGLDGVEIYNRHADANRDKLTLVGLVAHMTDPRSAAELEEGLRSYPDEMLASQVDYPRDYLAKWDADTQLRRLTGVAANDCHHNQVLLVKMVDENTVRVGTNVDRDDQMQVLPALLRPGIREMTQGHQPGDVLVRLDFDPYYRSFRNVCAHLLLPELSETAVRDALRRGRAYVSHDWMCDATGFCFAARLPQSAEVIASDPAPWRALLGDELAWSQGPRLTGRFPVPCKIRLLRGGQLVHQSEGDTLDFRVDGPGVFRVEGWLRLDGEDRPWVYSNPIYVR